MTLTEIFSLRYIVFERTAPPPPPPRPISDGLQCMCSETASLPPAECALDLQCEVSNGVCYQQIYRDEYGQYTRWGCYDYDLGGGLGALVGACEISNQDTRVRCCNDSDLCNRKLTIQPFPERMSLPTQGI